MNQTLEREQRQYCREVQKACPRALRKRLMADLQVHISDFLQDHPQSGREDIIRRFGEPTQFASEYTAAMGDDEMSKLLNKRKWIIRWSIIVGAILVLMVIITCIWVMKNSYEGRITEIEHTIKYESIVSETDTVDLS